MFTALQKNSGKNNSKPQTLSQKQTERSPSDQLLDLNKQRQHPPQLKQKLSKTQQPVDGQQLLKEATNQHRNAVQQRSHSDTHHYSTQLQQQQSQIGPGSSKGSNKPRVMSSNSQKRQSPMPSQQQALGLLKGGKKQASYQSFFQTQSHAHLGYASQQQKSSGNLLNKFGSTDNLQVQQMSSKLPLKKQASNIVIQPAPQKPVLNFTQPLSSQQQQKPQKQLAQKQTKKQEFLNVDAKTNKLLLDLIKPIQHEYDFEGFSRFVINASELTNQELFRELYNCLEESDLNELDELIQHAIADNFRHLPNKQRSRNTKKALNAGQSVQTLSFVDTQVKQQIQDDDFYTQIKYELREQTDDVIYQLMSDYQAAKFSSKSNGVIAGYGANTNQGISRNYNEDRVAIILNIMKPKQKNFEGAWPKCSFFGVYDGHGGNACADFLRDYLHQLIIKDDQFPQNPIQAIRNGFAEAEKLFLDFALQQEHEIGDIERSGSCATCMLVVDDTCYIANTGDSRAIMSVNGGKQILTLSNDHKPTDPIEVERILKNGGQIYQNASVLAASPQNTQIMLGPHRVFPGRLSVCRTFGDVEAKAEHLLGNSKVVVADPDISFFKVDKLKHDFVILGCDGIFDKLDDQDCVHTAWQQCINKSNFQDQKLRASQGTHHHQMCGEAVDAILKSTAIRKSADNITVVMVAFDSFFNLVQQSNGDVSSFQYKQIELQQIDLLQPPSLVPQSANVQKQQKNEILIDDTPSQQNLSGLPQQQVIGDTGDHEFSKSKMVEEPQNLSDIQEEDCASMISDRLLLKQKLAQQQNQTSQKVTKINSSKGTQRPNSSNKTQNVSSASQANGSAGLPDKKKYLTNSQSVLEPVKSIGKLVQPSHKLSSQTNQPNSRSLPKYLPLTEEQSQLMSQTMPYQNPAHKSNNHPGQSKSQKQGSRNFAQQEQFHTADALAAGQHSATNITIVKPGSAKRRKVFNVKTLHQQQQQNQSTLTSQFLSQVKQQSLAQKFHQGQSQPKSRNAQFQTYLVPKAWTSLNDQSANQNSQQIAQVASNAAHVQTFQGHWAKVQNQNFK